MHPRRPALPRPAVTKERKRLKAERHGGVNGCRMTVKSELSRFKRTHAVARKSGKEPSGPRWEHGGD